MVVELNHLLFKSAALALLEGVMNNKRKFHGKAGFFGFMTTRYRSGSLALCRMLLGQPLSEQEEPDKKLLEDTAFLFSLCSVCITAALTCISFVLNKCALINFFKGCIQLFFGIHYYRTTPSHRLF